MGNRASDTKIDFTFKLEGVAELVAKLAALGHLEDGKALRAAAKAGVKPIFVQAKANIPKSPDAIKTYKGRLVGPGFASRNIRTISQLKPAEGIARASVGVRDEAFYAVQFVEKGTKYQQAQHWLTEASEQTLEKQTDAVAESLRKSIEKYSK